MSIDQAYALNAQLEDTAPYNRVRRRASQWRRVTSDSLLLEVIESGVRLRLRLVPPPLYVPEPLAQTSALRQVVQQYADEGAVRPLALEVAASTRYWVPVFGELKKDGGWRLITNLRRLNECFPNDKFKMDSWGTVKSALKDPALRWGLTLDLKSWFHPLRIHSSSRRWMRFKLRTGEAFEVDALPFGLSCSPYWAHRLAKPILAWVRNTLQDVTVVWYVDDIAILGKTKEDVEQAAARLIEFLTDLGVQVNAAKSMREAATKIHYLGRMIDLTTGLSRPRPSRCTRPSAWPRSRPRHARACPATWRGLRGSSWTSRREPRTSWASRNC